MKGRWYLAKVAPQCDDSHGWGLFLWPCTPDDPGLGAFNLWFLKEDLQWRSSDGTHSARPSASAKR